VKKSQLAKSRFALTLAVATLVSLGAAGCSAANNQGSPAPTSSTSGSPTPSASVTTPPVDLTPSQALAEFKAIAQASVAKADSVGLMQTTVNSKYGDYVLVLDRNYNKDYQAAVLNSDGTYALIYEADAFTPAAALSALDLGATVKVANGVWSLTEKIEGKPTTYTYTVANGLFATESGASGGDSWTSTLFYGMTVEGHKIIDEALKTLNK